MVRAANRGWGGCPATRQRRPPAVQRRTRQISFPHQEVRK
nr:MAG TPA: hypothetical protein [Caudoviricetes sp.]